MSKVRSRAANNISTSAIIALCAGLILPLLSGHAFYINVGSQILIAAIFAMSLNILVGYGGLTSLGHAAFLGTSAYVVALLNVKFGFGFYESACMALITVIAMACLFGAIALRGQGITFLMITLALGQTSWGIAFRWADVTGGDNGLPGVKRPDLFGINLNDPAMFYMLIVVLFLGALAAMAIFTRSGLGLALQGTRDQPRRMAMLGHNVWMIRYIAYIIAALWAGIAGIAFIAYHGYIHPASLNLSNSAEALLMVIAGGAGTLFGPVIGAAIVILMKMVASAYVSRWMLLLGCTFIAIVIFLPEGVVPGLTKWFEKIRASSPKDEGKTQ